MLSIYAAFLDRHDFFAILCLILGGQKAQLPVIPAPGGILETLRAQDFSCRRGDKQVSFRQQGEILSTES